MKKTVLIINCKKKRLDTLADFILEINKELEVYTVDNAMAAYELFMEISIDIFIVEVVLKPDMPGDTSGIRLVEQIREIARYALTPIIFITSIKDPFMYANRELNCIGYLKTPYQPDELRTVLEKALHYRTTRCEDRALIFKRRDVIFPVRIKELVFIESIEHVMYMHMCNGEIVSVPYKTHSGIIYEANTDTLFQCSRKVVVNKEYVWGIDVSHHCILLRNNMGSINIGYTYRKRVLEEFKAINC